MNRDVEEVKKRLDIVDVVSGYLQLTKAGSNFRARCPFHNEKTPSFMISREKQIWHCFGCSEGGDVISFVEKVEGLDFREALKLLAQKAGVELQNNFDGKKNKEEKNLKENILDALEQASSYYVNNLKSEKKVLDYLKERGLTNETISFWQVGWSRDEWEGLYNFSKNKGIEAEILEKAGMVLPSKRGGFYDRFRGRIMFPIQNVLGKVIGFSGRIFIDKGEGGKYVNTPQTDVYDKSEVLFGIDKARLEMRRLDYVILVEGQMDVLMSHQDGVKNVVGISGTALTDRHLDILKRYTGNIIMAFDQDTAGEKATKKSIEAALDEGFNVKVLMLEEGKDPADMVLEGGWKKALKESKSVMDYYIDLAFRKYDIKNVIGKKQFAKEVLPFLVKLDDVIEQSVYLKKISDDLGLDESVIREAMKRFSKTSKRKVGEKKDLKDGKVRSRRIELEEELVGFVLNYPNEFLESDLEIESDLFFDESLRQVIISLSNFKGEKGELEKLIDELDETLHNRVKLAMFKVENKINQGDIDLKDGLREVFLELRSIVFTDRIEKIKQDIRRAEKDNNEKELERLSELFQNTLKEFRGLGGE